MNWFFWALLCPVLWSISSIVDQFLARDYFKNNISAFVMLTGLSSIPCLIIFACIRPDVFSADVRTICWLLLSSLVYIVSIYPYMTALQRDDVSIVAPIFQITPFAVALLSFLVLGETISMAELAAGSVILFAALCMTWSFEQRQLRLKTFSYAMLAMLLFACNTLLLRYWTGHLAGVAVAFWHMSGWVIFTAVAMLIMPVTRRSVTDLLHTTRGKIYGWSLLQDGLDILATLSLTLALSLAPAAALVSMTSGLHPAFVFVLGGLLARFHPRIFEPLKQDRQTALKIVCLIIMFSGLVWLYSLTKLPA